MNFYKLLFKRTLAFWIDGALAAIVITFTYHILAKFITIDKGIFNMILMPALTIFRDISGRSVGKRCTRLYVVSSEGHKDVKLYQLILRNITAPIIVFEGIVMVLRENSIRWGDLLAKTEVCYKPDNTKGLLK